MHGIASYIMPVKDYGIVLEPSKEGEPFFNIDGGGIREFIINKVDDTYYMFYDGASTHSGFCDGHDPTRHLWRACLAKSSDLINWEKLGPRLFCGVDQNPSLNNIYGRRDFWSASSPWVYFDHDTNRWLMYYLGADGVEFKDNIGVPSVYYSTCLAKAETPGIYGIEGNWIQETTLNPKAVCFVKNGIYPRGTTSPGSVIQNPQWTENSDQTIKKYMMFVTSGGTIAIARTNNLEATQNWDEAPTENGWIFDKTPALGAYPNPGNEPPIKIDKIERGKYTAPENAVHFYDSNTGWHFLFTNQFSQEFTHTDCNVVYWTRDPNKWDEKNSAVIIDKHTTGGNWGKTGVVGMPSVIQVSDDTLAVVYDACIDNDSGHLHRVCVLGYWKIPLLNDDGTPISFDGKAVTVNDRI